MIDAFKDMWRRIRGMFTKESMKTTLGVEPAMTDAMVTAIESWSRQLSGNAEWLTDTVSSLRIENGICREFADCVLAELDASVNIDSLDQILQHQIGSLNENLQEGLGLGSFVLKPSGPGKAEYVPATKIIPVSFADDGSFLDVFFLSTERVSDTEFYTRAERHYFINGNLTIQNRCFRSGSREQLGIPCPLDSVEKWAGFSDKPVTYPKMQRMDFGYYRNPIRNDIDGSKVGVSVFDSASGRIKQADLQAARLDWEYESGERAVHVDDTALTWNKRTARYGMAKLNKRLYRGLNIQDGKDKDLLKEYSPEMRDEAYRRGLEDNKREIEFIVGLAYGDLSDVQQVEKTASEVKAAKRRKYNRVQAMQNSLQKCLDDFVAGLAFYNGHYTSNYEFHCNFGDSVLVDDETERQQDRQDVSMGVMSHLEYRMKWYGEDEETAERNLPEQNQVME